MSDSPETSGTPAEGTTAPQTAAPVWTPPAAPHDSSPPPAAGSGGPAGLASERPEIAVGAAFAGGLVFALILKRLAR